ncbi:MAG: STAS domain-containing protein [Planctomycetes bacterium]|nr:STAS domain-containing protein [Planctomycetota bacterium]
MKIETTTKESFPTLILRGDFETDSVDSFLAAIDELRASGNIRILVSLRYVKYINSTALGAVVRARSGCKEAGGDLLILQPSRLSREIITKMGLETVLRIFDSDAEAASFLAGGGATTDAPADRAPDEADRVTVMFSFDDERAKLIPGKSKHGIGVLEAVDDATLSFLWDPARHDAGPETAAALFTIGSTMRNKLQLKLIRKEFFDAESTIESMTLVESGAVAVRARWSRMSDVDRQALARHQEDMTYLREQQG